MLYSRCYHTRHRWNPGVLSGAAALSFRKVDRATHCGKIFVAAMLVLATSAVYLAIVKHQTGNVLGGTSPFI